MIPSAGASRRVPALLLGALLALPLAAAAKPPFPELQLPARLQGERALQALGSQLPQVAAWYGMTPQRFGAILREDRNAWLDRRGRLLYIDRFPPPLAADSAGSTGTAATTAYDLGQTFLLHSKPGSSRTIYLDFSGHVASNTAWSAGTLNAQAFDLDGVPSSFSDTELTRIQGIWQRVAEDYAPFDVDVTTEEPPADALNRSSSSDAIYGTRAVITRNTLGLCNNSCGGVAYVGVFDYYSSSNPAYYQPAWVFYDALGNGDERYTAEATSHEVGHNLGLSHDGTASTGYYSGHGSGATGWAPIMGVGYYQQLTQWSRGEYPGANNPEDDLAIIPANGALLRGDSVGNSPASAAALAGSSSGGVVTVSQAGLIESAGDRDVFAFTTAGGSLQLTLGPAPRGPDLDLAASLYDGGGNLVASANDPAGLGATLATTVGAGTYYLEVDGVGDVDPLPGYSDYASLGQYQIDGSYPAPGSLQPPQAQISATPGAGTAPLAVNFDGAGSSDADGSISGYTWNFGDGSAEASGVSVNHTYTSAGSYTAILTVTDNDGLSSSADTLISASAPNPNTLHVQALGVSAAKVPGGYQCTASVTVHSNAGAAMRNVSVSGNWSGVVSGSGSAVTKNSGVATVKSPKTKSAHGSCAFAVDNLSLGGYSYDAAQNLVSSGVYTY